MRKETFNNKLSHDIKIAMLRKNISKLELSEKLNISYPTIRKYIHTPFSMRVNELDRICQFLELNLLIKLI